MKNLQGMVSFVESATAGSFTAAASRLDLTPAAVGKNVMRLEQELQVRLFNRTTRRLELTPEGSAFLEKAREALRLLDEAVTDLGTYGAEAVGRVRISTGVSFGRRFVLPALPALTARHPRLEVELSLDNRPVDLIAEGMDMAVRGGVMTDSNLIARRVCALHSVLVASPTYLHNHGVPTTPADLAGHRLLGLRFTSGKVSPWRFRADTEEGFIDWTPQAQIWTSDPESFLDLALAGEGICQAGLLYAAPHLRAGALRLVLHGQYDNGKREIALCYPHRKLLSKRVRVVVDALLGAFASEEDLQLDIADAPRAWCADTGAHAKQQ
ncbi:LysR family transcriptional regulator [Uliginosibacterium sp. H1]|uniref:LysR family transcriptional regulator n=1 Tax=Uliginosibacterium sp. H1 TaxID=3114757 RepID=UPI002E186458|nr:LysR family transcriptional regulator [Uliginosibacterium sp. H1]